MSPIIDIAICFDRNIETAALVLLASLRKHADTSRPIKVYAIVDGVSGDLDQRVADMRNTAFSVELMRVDNVYAHMQARDYISVGTYLRFLIPDLLTFCDKVLYLDIDVTVCRELSPLYDVDVSENALAAVPDFGLINSRLTWRSWRIEYEGAKFTFADYTRDILSIDGTGDMPYFNCGVLVLNLAFWRSTGLAKQTLDFLKSKPGLQYLDQDALNHAVGENYVRLDLRWNAFSVHACRVSMRLLDRWSRRGLAWQEVRSSWRADPWIIHYAGANKPWSPKDEPTPLDGVWWNTARTLPNFPQIHAAYLAACRDAGMGFEKCRVAPGASVARKRPA